MTVAPALAIPCTATSLFHTATVAAFIDIEFQGHRQTWPIRGKQLRAWLRRRSRLLPIEMTGRRSLEKFQKRKRNPAVVAMLLRCR
jgi:hypothetical protein